MQSVAKESGQQVDWHYSGGIANVLYIGDHAKVLAAVKKLRPMLERSTIRSATDSCRCDVHKPGHDPGRVIQVYGPQAHGPYRAGDELPEGTIAVDTH